MKTLFRFLGILFLIFGSVQCGSGDGSADGGVDANITGLDNDGDGYTEDDGDCDDEDAAIHPEALEDCTDNIDNNCDDETDDSTTYYTDSDGDGYGDASEPVEVCDTRDMDEDGIVDTEDSSVSPKPVASYTDCDDASASIYPNATDAMGDGIDQNCDDLDGVDADGDEYASEASGGEDCYDTSASIYPDATEVVDDGIDQDCDGSDEVTTGTDADGDGHDSEASGGDDCDDTNAAIYPGDIQDCGASQGDGVDNDCDDEIDEDRCFSSSLTNLSGMTAEEKAAYFESLKEIAATMGLGNHGNNNDEPNPGNGTPDTGAGNPDDGVDPQGGTNPEGEGEEPGSPQPETYHSWIFFNGQTLDFSGTQNREIGMIQVGVNSYRTIRSSDNPQIASGIAYALLDKASGAATYSWSTSYSAVLFDPSTINVSALDEKLSCKKDDDGWCKGSITYDLTSQDSIFRNSDYSNWSLEKITQEDTPYAFYVALQGFELSPKKSQQLCDLSAHVWIDNKTNHAKDDDGNDSDHYTTDGKLRIYYAINSNGFLSTYDWDAHLYFTLVGIDTTAWGAKYWKGEDIYADATPWDVDGAWYQKKYEWNSEAPLTSMGFFPILSSWGWHYDKGGEVNSLQSKVNVSLQTSGSEQHMLLLVAGKAIRKNGESFIPNETNGYLFYIKKDNVASVINGETESLEVSQGGASSQEISVSF